jgi:hypothetical protein
MSSRKSSHASLRHFFPAPDETAAPYLIHCTKFKTPGQERRTNRLCHVVFQVRTEAEPTRTRNRRERTEHEANVFNHMWIHPGERRNCNVATASALCVEYGPDCKDAVVQHVHPFPEACNSLKSSSMLGTLSSWGALPDVSQIARRRADSHSLLRGASPSRRRGRQSCQDPRRKVLGGPPRFAQKLSPGLLGHAGQVPNQ